MQLTISIPERQQRVHLRPGTLNWSEDEFFEFCQDMRIERSAEGEIIVMSPAGGYSGYQGMQVARQLGVALGLNREFFNPAPILRTKNVDFSGRTGAKTWTNFTASLIVRPQRPLQPTSGAARSF